MKMEQTEDSETLAYKIQKPGNYPEESIQHSFAFPVLYMWMRYSILRGTYSSQKQKPNSKMFLRLTYLLPYWSVFSPNISLISKRSQYKNRFTGQRSALVCSNNEVNALNLSRNLHYSKDKTKQLQFSTQLWNPRHSVNVMKMCLETCKRNTT